MSSLLHPVVPAVRSSFFSVVLGLAGLLSIQSFSVNAQSVTTGADKLVPRLCTNQCVQAREHVAVDGSGNATAIWSEPGGTLNHRNVLVARYNGSTNTWSRPRVLDNQYFLGNPLIAVDSAGNALAVWQYFFEGQEFFRSARYSVQSGTWSAPRTFWVGGYYESLASLEVAGNGDAFLHASGRNDAGTTYRYDAASDTWASMVNSSNNVEIAADGGGGALIADGSFYPSQYVAVSRYDPATKTQSRSTFLDSGGDTYDSNTGQLVSRTDVRFFSASRHFNGGEMVFWERLFEDYRTGAVTRTLRTAIFNRSTGTWRHLVIPKISNSQTLSGRLDADRFGNVNAIWVQYVSGYAKVVTARYVASAGRWSTPRVLSQGSYHTRDASLDTDINGNVIATWSQRTDTGTGSSVGRIFRTKAARYSLSANSWGTPATIQDVNRNSYRPHMGVSREGRAIVLWQQDTGARYGDGTPIKEMRADRVLPQ